jgi:hypothetical protein
VSLERGPLSLVSTTEELLEKKSSGSCLSPEYGRRGSAALITWHPLSANVSTNFSDKRRSLGRYSSLASAGHGSCSARARQILAQLLHTYIAPREVLCGGGGGGYVELCHSCTKTMHTLEWHGVWLLVTSGGIITAHWYNPSCIWYVVYTGRRLLLGYDAVLYDRNSHLFRQNVRSPSSGWTSKLIKRPSESNKGDTCLDNLS